MVTLFFALPLDAGHCRTPLSITISHWIGGGNFVMPAISRLIRQFGTVWYASCAHNWWPRKGCAVIRAKYWEDFVKFVLFQTAPNAEILPGLLTDRGVVDISTVVKKSYTPQLTMTGIIDDFDRLRPALQRLAGEGPAIALAQVRLRPPLPRPGKILACIANYWEHAQREARQLNMFMKNPDAVVGPGDTIVLPEFTVPWIFMRSAELALVIKGPAKMVKAKDWKRAVFGYTAIIDVSAREQGRKTWPASPLTSWLGKSFDTFAPIGPCIATADEIEDPNDLIVRFWNEGQLRHNYNTDDMEHRVQIGRA